MKIEMGEKICPKALTLRDSVPDHLRSMIMNHNPVRVYRRVGISRRKLFFNVCIDCDREVPDTRSFDG